MDPLGYIVNRQLNERVVIRNKLFKERLGKAKNFYRKDLFAHYGCVNAIEFSAEGELLISGGDDRRVLLWSVPKAIHGKGTPITMETNHVSNIFCLSFDSANSKIFSGGNDDQVILHDLHTGSLIVKLPHKKPVYSLSVNPHNDGIIATAGDDGRVLIYDVRESSNAEPVCVAKQKTGFHSVMFNPFNSRLLATANSEEGISLWDYRKPKEVLIRYDADGGEASGISVCFNSTGSRLLALRRRLPPVLYATQSQTSICQFYHPQYYNSCTMKTCCFAGDNDEYILGGSDDFNLYMWQIPKDDFDWGTSHVILKGHRSIVNQVRYNKNNNLIASSGVEKMVKLWSTLPIGNWKGSLLKEHTEPQRRIYSHDEYVMLIGNSGQRISHDYSDQSTEEDVKMLAFFDSLIQRELEGWDSPTEPSSDTESDGELQSRLYSVPYLPWHLMQPPKQYFDETRKQVPNRIMQLIAEKRSKLVRLAFTKSSSFIHRHKVKQRRKRRPSYKTKSSNNPNNNGSCSSSSYTKYSKTNGTSKKASSGKYNTRLSASNSNSASYIIDRENRKHKLHVDKSERWTRSKKCKTRHQSFKDICENSVSNSSIDAPSTSTGITSSNTSVFRIIEQDSDEDIPPNSCLETRSDSEGNFVNILPTPLNGSHDMCLNALDMTNHNSNGNVVALSNDDYLNSERASTSSATNNFDKRLMAHSNEDPCIDGFSNSDDLYGYVNSTSYLNVSSYVNDSDSSDCEYDYTPIKQKCNSVVSTPDSGFVTGPCSSSGSTYAMRSSRNHPPCSSRSVNSSYNGYSSDDDGYVFERFKKRVKKPRLNIRKQIGCDSDSN